jgi:hypothetical protein
MGGSRGVGSGKGDSTKTRGLSRGQVALSVDFGGIGLAKAVGLRREYGE